MKHLLVGLSMILFSLEASAAWEVAQLLEELGHIREGRARFVETKYISLLDEPIVSSGELSFTAPDRLEKKTLIPRPETLLLDGDDLSIERDAQRLSISLTSQPEALAFVDSIRGTLTGDRQALERHYDLHLSGHPDHWTLILVPSEERIAAILRKISISGRGNHIYSIEYLQADGDRALMSIEPLPEP